MSVGNYGAVVQQLQGLVMTEFGVLYNNQGVALFPELIARVAARSDRTESNLKIHGPYTFDGTNEVTVTTSPAVLFGFIAQANILSLEDEAILFYEATPTEGTTRYVAMVNLDASSTVGSTYSVVFPEPIPMLKIYWSDVDNGQDTDIESTTLGDTSGVKVLTVYAQ